jgi:hypothetical protein
MEKQKEEFNLFVIELGKGYLIKDKKDGRWNQGKVSELEFNGKLVEPTFHLNWYSTETLDNCLLVIPEKKETDFYQLKENVSETETLPKIKKHIDYDSDERAFYDAVYKTIPETKEEIILTKEIVCKIDDIEKTKGFSFTVKNPTYPNSQPGYKITEDRAIHQLVDTIIFPKPALALRPTKLSSVDSFEIIRNYINDNIDPKYAEVTSNYEFCLTVTKKIPLSEQVEFTYDDNFNLFGRKRKPKFKKGYRTERKQVVFECAPIRDGKLYSGYSKCVEFQGETYEDLVKNVNEYLERIIKEINEPLIDCPNCKGQGVIVEK